MATKDEKGRLIVGAAIGALRDPYERAKALFGSWSRFHRDRRGAQGIRQA